MSFRDPKAIRLLLAVFLCGAVLWTYFLSDLLPFGYRARQRQYRELQAAQETLSAELEKARRSVSSLPQLEEEQRELERKWRQAESLLPTDKEVAQLLSQVTQAGEQSGVTFELFKPNASRPQEFFNENPVEVQVRGGFHQVGVFLARIANLSRIVNVTDLRLEALDQGRNKAAKGQRTSARTDHTLTAGFTATAYSLRDVIATPEAAGAAEQPGKGRKSVRGGKLNPAASARAAVQKHSGPTEGEQ